MSADEVDDEFERLDALLARRAGVGQDFAEAIERIDDVVPVALHRGQASYALASYGMST